MNEFSEISVASTSVADQLARDLFSFGIRRAYGMPGGEVVAFIDALARAGIQFVLARNESAAAIMAAGEAQMTGVPGLLVTTLGPGLANAVNGIADAVQERNPLIVVSGVVDSAQRGTYTHQIIDHAALLRPLVKASFEVSAQNAAVIVQRVVDLARQAPCGPVHLDLAPQVALERSGARASAPVRTVKALSSFDADMQSLLQGRLQAAKRPIIIAGLEAARAGLGEFLAPLNIPVITTYKAKGLIDEHSAFSLGAAGLSPLADRILLPLVKQSDLVLLIGYDPIEMRPGWLDPFRADQEVVELTGHVCDHAMHRANWRLLGNLHRLVEALSTRKPLENTWIGGEIAEAKEQLAKIFAVPLEWGPHAVFESLAQHFPDGGLLTVDSGAHRILLSQMWRARHAFEMLQSSGWCTMGSALPLAIGAKMAQPARKVVAVLGDGGLEMTLGELGTIRDQNLDIVVLVVQDKSLGLIELKQSQAGLASNGVRLGATRFDEVARAFGGHGVEVSSRAELDLALAAAFAGRGLNLISAKVSATAYVGAF